MYRHQPRFTLTTHLFPYPPLSRSQEQPGRQQDSFRRHIHASQQTGLPIIVHTRDAEADTLTLLGEEMDRASFPGVIHCFTASADFARKALEVGRAHV